MADAEVKLKVSADADIDALEKLRDELKKLRAEQKDFERQGAPQAAGQVRRRADRLEKRIDTEANRMLRVEDDDARRAKQAKSKADSDSARKTKDRAAEEKRVTRELKEQAALRKAGVTRAGRVANFAVGAVPGVGGGPVDGILGMGMRSGIAPVMIASAIAAATVGVTKVFADERDKDKAMKLRVQSDAAVSSYRMNRAAGVYGSSGELVGQKLAAEEEVAGRKARRAELDEKAREKWNDPSTWSWFGLRKNAGQREREENEVRIAKGEREADVAGKGAEKRYRDVEGGLELAALRGRSKRSLEGQREAFVAEQAGAALAKYKEVIGAGGSPEMAKEMATLTYQNALRDRQAAAGAGLVDAKSGGAGIAAAAGWATRVTPQEAEIGAQLDTLIGAVNQGNQAAQLVKQSK